jgi:pimeloyl-ACP methyl ester carboxylesterase
MPFLHAGGHRLEYRWAVAPAGASDAHTLVLLHEGLGSTAMWKTFPDELAEATGCRALVYSRYGYGKSDLLTAPRKPDYLHREALEVLRAVLEHLEIENPILVGHSDGASIALIHAGAGLRAVRALVLLAPHVFVETLSVDSIVEVKAAFETTDLPARLAKYHDDAVRTFWGWNDIWLHPDFRRWNIEEYLPGITCPVLVIQGEDDQFGTLAQVQAIERQVRGPFMQLVLAQCRHSPQIDQKPRTLAFIADFVAQINALD